MKTSTIQTALKHDMLADRDDAPHRPEGLRWRWKRAMFRVVSAMAFFAACTAGGLEAAYSVTSLKTEYSVNPTAIDVAQPRLQWRVESDERGQRQTAWQILVASSREFLAQDRGDLWDSGKVAGDQTTFIRYAGKKLTSSQTVFWKVRSWDRDGKPSAWSEPASWTMGLLDQADWKGVWIAAPTTSEALLLRREFTVKPGLRRAIAHVSGVGIYELGFNGAKAGEDLLAPGWTNFDATILYRTEDVTSLLQEGANAATLELGNGMYHVVRRNRFSKFTGSFGPLRAILHLQLEYADGSVEFVGTDENWRTHPGGVTFNSIYGGEDYDPRLEPQGWRRAGFDDSAWARAVPVNRPAFVLKGHSRDSEPLRIIETREPVSVRELSPGVVLYDFGQNTSFMPRIRVTGPAGSIIRMTPGEVVKEDGTIERGTMGGAHRGSAWWQYTKATDDEETWFPKFYYVGSRYLYTELVPAKEGGEHPKLESVQMEIVHAEAEPLGEFATSNPLMNRIRDLVRWAQRSNMVSVLTDCPHREKLGWIEQFHLNGPSIRYEFDTARIFTKAMWDMAEAQTDEGLIPNIAPEYTQFKNAFRNAAEWGAAFILVPWQQYQFTGDIELLRSHYERMKRYFAFLENRTRDGLLHDGLGDWYDLDINKKGRAGLTPAPITATAFYYHDAVMLSRIATLLGKSDDAAAYAAKARDIHARYQKEFYNAESGTYATNTQASNSLALGLGIAEPDARNRVIAAIVKDVEERGYATAGDIGFRYLLRSLADAGRSDVVYALINQDEKPGYGYQIKQDATALPESWNASLGASHNHFMLGQVIEWFYHDLAGIRPVDTAPGFKEFVIAPQIVGDLTWVEASYHSIHGKIASRWERVAPGAPVKLKVTVPTNTTATVYLPAKDAAAVTEGGRALAQAKGVKLLRMENGCAVLAVESGSYVFDAVK